MKVSAKAEEYDRTVKPVVGRDTSHASGHHKRFVESSYSASYSGWDDDKAWSSQEWKADKLMDGRSKAKAKPQRRESASSSTRTIPIGERSWTDVEPGEYSISDYDVSKKLIHLLRHGSLHRENDGAI